MKKLISYIEENNSKKFIDHLVTLLENPFFDINRAFFKGDLNHTLFSYSCLHGNLEICKHLASKNADPIGKKSGIGKGFPLAISILHNQFHISDWLQQKFNIDCSINSSWPLTMSAFYGNLPGIKYALNHNADIHADNDYTLRRTAENGQLSIVKYLLSKDADIHASDDYALRAAASNGHLSVIKYLLSKGANIHASNNHALRLAIQNNQFKTAEYLLDHGADPNTCDHDKPILQQLLEKNQLPLSAKAVSYGADLTTLSPSQQQKLNNYIFSKKMAKTKKL